MILEKAKQFFLVAEIGAQVKADALRIVVLQAVVEPLVIAEVEPQLLKLPLLTPISFGNEEEVRIRFLDGGDHATPILCGRPNPRAPSPGPFKDFLPPNHFHLATNSVH